ncbi:sugar phosphate isomerase/epimerase family protein [Amycolatopsis echigonensis]|uniref:Sugar phosphate isomerase/epimerase n=1 Tax=Amycolatopsis echigonensis TaxID=2576905 RepID=A0A8E1W7D9_9PSEU|nr:sugar phosphate isomerase/epimerase family protein [Amycolatopsis echigonensis]MBB2504889.1 sugar phosphate isomerase/epimerase [Amycolatopsis echigonensis]
MTPELLATCWTSAGDVMPLRTGDRSPIGIERRVAAVASAGYSGMGLNHADLVAARDEIGLPRLAELLSAHGLHHVELELIDYWWETGPRRETSDRVRADLLDAARVLDIDQIKVAAGSAGDTYDPGTLRESFAALADDARAAGTRIALEPCAFSSMPSLEPAVALVTDVDHPQAGLLLDIWHIFRSGMDYATMADLVPADKLFAVELNDGAREQVGTGLEDTFDNRMLCGQGDFDVAGFIDAVRRIGYPGPWGVEIMSHHHRALDPETALSQAFQTAADCLIATRAQAGRTS